MATLMRLSSKPCIIITNALIMLTVDIPTTMSSAVLEQAIMITIRIVISLAMLAKQLTITAEVTMVQYMVGAQLEGSSVCASCTVYAELSAAQDRGLLLSDKTYPKATLLWSTTPPPRPNHHQW